MADTLLVAILGAGLVGKELIDQMVQYMKRGESLHYPKIQIVAVANSKGYVLIKDLAHWQESLAKKTGDLSLEAFTQELVQVARGQSIALVDNTASQAVAEYYPEFLRAGFHIVTPNKKAFSGIQELYNQILQAAQSHAHPRLVYQEATVGAGLPVISTCQDLIVTGDEITKIEGVFSGTLSYIFNEFSAPGAASSATFSSIVRKAKEQGFTEPHPGDDLNGVDVARKLTILTRLIDPSGSRLGLKEGCFSVETRTLVPEPLRNIKNGADFVDQLAQFDQEFTKLNSKARESGQVIRYVGEIDLQRKVVKASLESFPFSHPFAASLGSSDNMILFHSKRYAPRPLIVQGAGAGAACTAMGVLADIVKLAGRVVK